MVESGRSPAGWGAEGVCQVRLPSRAGGTSLDVDSSLRMAEVRVLSNHALHPPRAAAAEHPTKLQEEGLVRHRPAQTDRDFALAEHAFDGWREHLIATNSISVSFSAVGVRPLIAVQKSRVARESPGRLGSTA